MSYTRKPLRRQASTKFLELKLTVNHYRTLQLESALKRRQDYVEVCKELSLLMKGLYGRACKPLQLALYEDITLAFRLLPLHGGRRQKTAAQELFRAAEGVLPQQRLAVAKNALKQAELVENRMRKRSQGLGRLDQEAGGKSVPSWMEIPQEVLSQIMGHLDAPSLANAMAVCQEWRELASDDELWEKLFQSFFVTPPLTPSNGVENDSDKRAENLAGFRWRHMFVQNLLDIEPGASTSNRFLCKICMQPFWGCTETVTRTMLQSTGHRKCQATTLVTSCQHEKRHPLSAAQVIDSFLEMKGFRKELGESVQWSDDESESDNELDADLLCQRIGGSRLWRLPVGINLPDFTDCTLC